MKDIPQIFISATSDDLSSCRARIVEAVSRQRCYAASQTHFAPTYKEVNLMLRETIAPCDAMIHIVGEYYGYEAREREPGELRRSYTQMEYEIAQELGVPVLLFICKEGFPYHPHPPETSDKRKLQETYRRRLMEETKFLYAVVSTPDELEIKAIEALRAFREQHPARQRRKKILRVAEYALMAVAALAILAGVFFAARQILLRNAPPTYSEKLGPFTAATVPPDWRGPVLETAWVVPGCELAMVPILPGEFKMGSPPNEKGRDSDEKQHTFRISRPFWLGRYEVTQAQWQFVMGNNPSYFKSVGKDAPVESVSWLDAMEFCKKVTEIERAAGRCPAGYAYTLPTDAEWEYACRAGSERAYGGTGKLDEMGWYWDNSGKQTHPVGGKKPNQWGLYDMHGNVREWCRDWTLEFSSASATDPIGEVNAKNHIVRGGGWDDNLRTCRAAFRDWKQETDRHWRIGFRLALCPVPEEK